MLLKNFEASDRRGVMEGSSCVGQVRREWVYLVEMGALPLRRYVAHLHLNASGLSEDSQLAVEIPDESLRLVPGYTAADCTSIKDEIGLRVPLS